MAERVTLLYYCRRYVIICGMKLGKTYYRRHVTICGIKLGKAYYGRLVTNCGLNLCKTYFEQLNKLVGKGVENLLTYL